MHGENMKLISQGVPVLTTVIRGKTLNANTSSTDVKYNHNVHDLHLPYRYDDLFFRVMGY